MIGCFVPMEPPEEPEEEYTEDERDPSDIAREDREYKWMFGDRNRFDDLDDAKERGLV